VERVKTSKLSEFFPKIQSESWYCRLISTGGAKKRSYEYRGFGCFSFFGVGYSHRVLWGDLEALEGLHRDMGLAVVLKLHESDAWLGCDHPDFSEARILLEQDLEHHACGLVRQVLDEKDVVGRNMLLRDLAQPRGLVSLHTSCQSS